MVGRTTRYRLDSFSVKNKTKITLMMLISLPQNRNRYLMMIKVYNESFNSNFIMRHFAYCQYCSLVCDTFFCEVPFGLIFTTLLLCCIKEHKRQILCWSSVLLIRITICADVRT